MKWEDLFLNGSLIDLDISWWRGQRKLLAEDLNLELGPAAERVFSLGRKRLIPKEKMVSFQKVEHAARKAVDAASLPFPLSGARFIPTEKVVELGAGLVALRSEFEDSARQFAFEYPQLRDEVRPVLVEAADEVWRSIANGNGTNEVGREAFEQQFLSRIESAYPDPRELSRKFRFRWRFFAITAPRNGTLTEESAVEATERDRVRSDIRRRVVASEEAEVREVIASMAKDLRAQLMGPISFVLEKVKKGESVNERSLNNIRRICDRVKNLNFLGDVQLDQALKELQGSLVGMTAAEVRTVDGVRAQLQTAFTGVAAEIKTLAEADVESMAESLKLGRRRFRL
ncbi:MAG: DUF3150 domain-containing protein [Planctomycetota bacterium]|nr:DUF3150 domain-containing protein [Planctomycetota bacterium]